MTEPTTSPTPQAKALPTNPWPALWAVIIGFFMILVDSTIVQVANPAIMTALDASVTSVVWVTSAYLLAFAVPLLVTGRLGDRFGPKNIYLIGLVVFTLASAWCGFSGSITMLVVARVFQGFGAALMNPQTMAIITRTFPPNQRGAAMGIWGAAAGMASLVGPLAGGVLVDSLGWEWIFFVNVPVGVVAFIAAWRIVPALPTNSHTFDIPGVIFSGLGMFALVFGIQEGSNFDWDWRAWTLIGAGILVLVGFIAYQSRVKTEPLVPLELFRDRNFSLGNIAITAMGFAVTSLGLPLMFYAQGVRGLSPTGAALLMVPMAIVTGVLAPFVGRLADRVPPRYIAGSGFTIFVIALVWTSREMTPDSSTLALIIPLTVMGLANAMIWSPLSASATHNLPPAQAGAGAGIYNTTRSIGAVLGVAAMGALMTSRLGAHGLSGGQSAEGGIAHLPAMIHEPFAAAMADSIVLPAVVLVVGIVASVFLAQRGTGSRAGHGGTSVIRVEDDDDAAPSSRRA